MRIAKSRSSRHFASSGDASDKKNLIYVASLTCMLVFAILNVSVFRRSERSRRPLPQTARLLVLQPESGPSSALGLSASARFVLDGPANGATLPTAATKTVDMLDRLREIPLPDKEVPPVVVAEQKTAKPLPTPPPKLVPPPPRKRRIDFASGERFLFYGDSEDWCKPIGHWQWSFTCAIGEALYLNRTFVLDPRFCPWWMAEHFNPSKKYVRRSPSAPSEFMGDFRLYYDWDTLATKVRLVLREDFFREMELWDKNHMDRKVSVTWVDELASVEDLQRDEGTLIMREVKNTGERYWYQVCHVNKAISRPWDALWPSESLMDIVYAISDNLRWDFDVVHVVRRGKAGNKKKWPHLDVDTSAPKLVETLQKMIKPNRRLYIATDETQRGFFDPLMVAWTEVYQLEDFKDLWGDTSEWRRRLSEELGRYGEMAPFDDFMRRIVDNELIKLGKKKVETFNDLTQDPVDGLTSS